MSGPYITEIEVTEKRYQEFLERRLRLVNEGYGEGDATVKAMVEFFDIELPVRGNYAIRIVQ